MSDADDDTPPRPGRGMLKRFALAGALIALLTAATVSSAGLLEVHELVSIVKEEGAVIPGIAGALDDVPAGKPQTILVLGSDQRYIDRKEKNPVRSDTILLVRLDPSKEATAVLSIPRDLKVYIPGHGTDKINAAYADGGPKLSVQTIRRLLGIKINHVVNIDFRGFRSAVDRLGCVYVDVDRDYFNDNNPPAGGGGDYATIDINPGYQKLCGQRSLDYVRYRHFDDDLVRAARQQDFLRQAKDQIGLGRIFGDRRTLLRIFARYTETDIRSNQSILRLLKLAFESSSHPIREVHFRGDIGPSYVTVTDANLAQVKDEFLNARASGGPRPVARHRASGRKARKRSKGLPPGVVADKVTTENFVAQASAKTRFPLMYPAARLSRGALQYGKPRVYRISDRGRHRYRAYRIVVSTGLTGQFYGVQGTGWKSPPILDDPSEQMRMRGRTYDLFYDGTRLRLVAWRTPRAVYWVSNSLSQTLNNQQMLAIARSLARVGSK
jgi:polyisoprenyl-teichoic acid--peptidoglycan teichoic acid transferase